MNQDIASDFGGSFSSSRLIFFSKGLKIFKLANWKGIHNRKFWESHFIPSHFFEKFQIPLKFQSLKQTNNQSNNYINIPKFIILGCYKLPHLKWISSSRFEEARKKRLWFGGSSNKYSLLQTGVLPHLKWEVLVP